MDYRDARSIVATLHDDLFGRSVHTVVFEAVASELAQHGNCGLIVMQLTQSEAFRAHLISEAHELVFGALPTPEALAEYDKDIRAGRIDKYDVALELVQRVAAQRSRSDGSVLSTAYRVRFDRVLTVPEADHWIEQIRRSGRTNAVRSLWTSEEGEAVVAATLYRMHLLRDPDADGLDWARRFLSAHGVDGLRSALVSSEEYLERARAASSTRL